MCRCHISVSAAFAFDSRAAQFGFQRPQSVQIVIKSIGSPLSTVVRVSTGSVLTCLSALPRRYPLSLAQAGAGAGGSGWWLWRRRDSALRSQSPGRVMERAARRLSGRGARRSAAAHPFNLPAAAVGIPPPPTVPICDLLQLAPLAVSVRLSRMRDRPRSRITARRCPASTEQLIEWGGELGSRQTPC